MSRAPVSSSPGEMRKPQAIWKHLILGARTCWDLLQLCQLPEGSPTLENMRGLAMEADFPTDVWLSGDSPYVTLDSSWLEYYAGLAAKARSNLRNRFKRLNQIGPVAVETVTAKDSVPEALECGLRLEESAWKRDAGTAISCDPQVRKFYELFAARAADRNWLRLNFLKAGTERVAFDYSSLIQQSDLSSEAGLRPGDSA